MQEEPRIDTNECVKQSMRDFLAWKMELAGLVRELHAIEAAMHKRNATVKRMVAKSSNLKEEAIAEYVSFNIKQSRKDLMRAKEIRSRMDELDKIEKQVHMQMTFACAMMDGDV